MSENTQRTVIVGGTSGIGLAAAQLLLERGHEVVVAGRDPERLAQALKVLRENAGDEGSAERVSGLSVDARDSAALSAFFAEVGAFDHLVVTLTARGGIVALADVTAEEVRRQLDGKLIPHLLTVQAALPTLRADGSVTLVSAVSAQLSSPGLSVLGSSNATVDTAARILAAELAPRRVNAVSPGVIATGWWDWVPEEQRGSVLEGATAGIPLGRPGRPEEVAQAIEFMVTNGYTTGVVLPVDGGARLGGWRG